MLEETVDTSTFYINPQYVVMIELQDFGHCEEAYNIAQTNFIVKFYMAWPQTNHINPFSIPVKTIEEGRELINKTMGFVKKEPISTGMEDRKICYRYGDTDAQN